MCRPHDDIVKKNAGQKNSARRGLDDHPFGNNGIHVHETGNRSPLLIADYAFLIKSSHIPLSSIFTDSNPNLFFSQ